VVVVPVVFVGVVDSFFEQPAISSAKPQQRIKTLFFMVLNFIYDNRYSGRVIEMPMPVKV
jgi:hypothetical protein